MDDLDRGDIVYVSPYFPPDVGGMERVAEELAVGVAERRRVLVLTSSTRAGAPPGTYPAGMTVRRLPTLRLAQVPFMPRLVPALLRTPRHAVMHVHIAQAFVPEVVWLVAVLTRRPYITHFHLDIEPSTRLGPLFLLYKRVVLSRVLRAAARVIVLTPEQAELVQERYGVAARRVVVIPNGVGREFSPSTEPRCDGGRLRLLFVGRLSSQKNLPRLLRTMALVRQPVDLVVVGDGAERARAERLAAELGLTDVVRFVGEQRGAALVDWYRWADALVLTSDREGMPLVLLEAMTAGLPIVANDVPGVRATLGEAGLVVAPDPAALAAAVDHVAADADLRDDLRRRSLERAARYGWDEVVAAVEDVYRAVVG